MEKRMKKEDKFSSTEVGALIEALRFEIKPVLEAIPDMQEKLDSIFEQVGVNTEKLVLLETAVKGNAEKIDRNAEKIDRNAEKIDRNAEMIEQNIDKIDGNAEKIEINRVLVTRVLEELKSKVDRKDFEILEKKVASLTN